MSVRPCPAVPTRWIALAALVLALAAALRALTRALDVEDPAPVAAAAIAVPRFAPLRAGSGVALRVVMNDDPFSPDRAPPPVRYRLARAVSAEPPAPPPPRVPTVLGTAVATEGQSFATCVIGTAPPVHVRVGDAVGSYVVESIERGHVVFADPSGRRVDVRTTGIRD